MPSIEYSSEKIRQNADLVMKRIAAAALKADRDPDTVRLVAVTKGHPISAVNAAVAAGLKWLGENYVQEGLGKISGTDPSQNIVWHMIGHIQSRKAKEVSTNFDFIHSIDRVKIAAHLNKYCSEIGRLLPVMIECNVSGEESKYGFPAWSGTVQRDLFFQVEKILQFPALQVIGVMTMPPFFDDPEGARPYFSQLRHLSSELNQRFGLEIGSEISMGMSGDYEVAVEEGATIVRIGTALFGPRPD